MLFRMSITQGYLFPAVLSILPQSLDNISPISIRICSGKGLPKKNAHVTAGRTVCHDSLKHFPMLD